MIPSTRICIAAACQAQSRLIQSIKELDFHKGHSSSSLGQITKKLKETLPDFQIQSSIKQIVDTKCEQMYTIIHNIQEELLKTCDEYLLIEASTKFINGEYQQLNDKAIDTVIKNLQQNLEEQVGQQLEEYKSLQNSIAQKLDNYLNLFNSKQEDQQVEKIEQVENIEKVENLIKFLPMPEVYKTYTTLEFQNKRVKHLDGYPTFVMTNFLGVEGNKISYKISQIQEKYVGIALGLMEKTAIEKDGLILTGEQLQKSGHGTYLNFNDKCIYHSDVVDSANKGKDMGIEFSTGNIVSLELSEGKLIIKNESSGNEYVMEVGKKEMIFVVWLDLSEVEIIQ